MERRRRGVLRWCEPAPVHDCKASGVLEREIEATVLAADIAWSFHERLFVNGSAGESPFQFRRSRVDRAQHRFAEASLRLQARAQAWLSEHEDGVDEQARLAVGRMIARLQSHPVSPRFPVREGAGTGEATVDVLENVLANLRQRRARGVTADPFRRVSARQDVIHAPRPLPSRHPAGHVAAARR